MARTFDGVDDEIRCNVGALSGITGYGSIALVVRRVGSAEPVPIAAYQANTARTAFHFDGGDMYYVTTAGFVSAGFTVDANIWNVAVATKDTGTVAVRFHQYGYDDGIWQRGNSSGTVADGSTSASTIRLGGPGAANPYDGDIAVAAWWKDVVLTDAQVETLPHSLQAWLALSPTAMWVLDQSATTQTVIDLTGGGANQSAITGTAVATSSAPIGYGFDPVIPATAAAAGGDATATPGVIATTAALPQAAAGAGTTATPVTVTATSTLPQPAVNTAAGPAAVAATVSMPNWAVNTSAVPDTVPVVVALPQATAGETGSGATATPAVIAGTTTLPQPAVNVGAAPAVTALTVALPSAAAVVDDIAAPATIAAVVSLPAPTVQAGGNVTVNPAVIAGLVALPQAGISTLLTPAVIQAVVALPLATVGESTLATPAVIAMTAAMPQPGAAVAAGPGVIALVVALPVLDILGEVRNIEIAAALATPRWTAVTPGTRWTAALEED